MIDEHELGVTASLGVVIHPGDGTNVDAPHFNPDVTSSPIVSPSLRILVVDDHSVVCEGLSLRLDSERGLHVVGCAASGEDAIAAAQRLRPDVVIMDLVLPSLSGVDAICCILHDLPQTYIVALSACHSLEQIRRTMRAGAHAYVLKSAAGHELTEAIRKAAAGQPYLCRAIVALHGDHALQLSSHTHPIESFSDRERQVLQCLVTGMTSAQIGRQLSLSCKTVDTYCSRMMFKLGVGRRIELLRAANEYELPAA